jgi:hypothetical protein
MSPHSEFSDPQAILAPQAGAPKWLVALEAAVGATVEAATALLVVAEVVILFAGVGLQFNHTDPEMFRAAVSKSGYYKKWKATFGDDAWRVLEKYTGPLL